MATNQPYSLQDLMDRINTLVNNDSDTPASSDDEWTVRLNLIYQAIGNWEGQDVFWDELWSTYTHAATVTGTSYVLALTDLRFPANFLRLTLNGSTTYIPIISPEEYVNYRSDSSARVAYLTGNNHAGWTLNLGWTPTSGDGIYGATISFNYYKYAFKPTVAADIAEMSDPNFLVYWVAAQKSLLEGQNNKFGVYNAEAQRCLDTMRLMNELKPTGSSDTIVDLDAVNAGAVLGE